jgi:hypothetical protein
MDSSFKSTWKRSWASERELILMPSRMLKSIVPPHLHSRTGYTGTSLGPLSSNRTSGYQTPSDRSSPEFQSGLEIRAWLAPKPGRRNRFDRIFRERMAPRETDSSDVQDASRLMMRSRATCPGDTDPSRARKASGGVIRRRGRAVWRSQGCVAPCGTPTTSPSLPFSVASG